MERLLQLQEEDMARRRAWEADEERRQNERNELERRRCSALYVSNQMVINNAKVLHDQERHQKGTTKPAFLMPNTRGGPTTPTSQLREAHLIHPLTGPRQLCPVSSLYPISCHPKESRGPSINTGRCLRPSLVIHTSQTRQLTPTRDISGEGKVCFVLLLYILVSLFSFRYYFFLPSLMNVVGVFPI
ncbi:hypothetical protein HanPI659440_Chr07g0261331 [Helianthus annuus]|nr:hypothetical protein HanPI659440_Chr07g0261331 [Helianthus annuus]